MEKKSNIFKPDIGYVNNNKQVYYSFLDDSLDIRREEEDPRSFMKKIDRSGSYMFRKEVIIKTKDKNYDTKIAGKMGDRIITLDNDIIPIDNIISISEK